MGKGVIESGWNLDNSYARLPEAFFSPQSPTPVEAPSLVILNHSLASTLGLNAEELKNKDALEVFAGNALPQGSYPIAQAYAGHQFGHFTMLGDGRALLLGEQITPTGERYDIQLKGSGPTKYSRRGDGRAAIGPMLREYIISEAMHAYGIPTTRSLAVVSTGEYVYRENILLGSVLTRVAASHIRVGTFQYAAKWCTPEELKALVDYTINRHYPDIKEEEGKYLLFLKEVIRRQAQLIAQWQTVGFIHGVMNTDNMAISGETIDYGPCAFMDNYDPETVFSSIDRHGRYAYGNQPKIAQWNLARFAETLVPFLADNNDTAVDIAQDAISGFEDAYHIYWMSGMRGKLGLFNEEEEDEDIIKELLALMHKHEADFTNTFKTLTISAYEKNELFKASGFIEWEKKWRARQARQQEDSTAAQKLMQTSNPAVVPRNHRVEEALEAATKGNYEPMDRLLAVLAKPFEYSLEHEEYSTLPPKNACRYQTFCGT